MGSCHPCVLTIGSSVANEAYQYLKTYGFSHLQIDCLDFTRSTQVFAPDLEGDFGAQVPWAVLALA